MDKRDIALQLSCPVVPVPLYSPLEVSENNGSRVLVAGNGTFIEITREWCRLVRKIGEVSVTVPYGKLAESSDFKFSKLPVNLLYEFNTLACQSPDLEMGAMIVWNQQTDQFRLVPSVSIEATGSFLRYQHGPKQSNEHVIIDCHSHARHPAYFSETDDKDDCTAIRFAFVVGNCDQDTQTMALRLCIKGIFESLSLDSITQSNPL